MCLSGWQSKLLVLCIFLLIGVFMLVVIIYPQFGRKRNRFRCTFLNYNAEDNAEDNAYALDDRLPLDPELMGGIRFSFDNDELDTKHRLKKILEMIKNPGNFEPCKPPFLPIYAPEMMKFFEEVPPINCNFSGISWVVCENSKCTIQDQANAQYGKISCSFTDIIRNGDHTVTAGNTTTSSSGYKLEKSDVVAAYCWGSKEGDEWEGILTDIRDDKEIWNRTGWNLLPPDALKLNILMFGFDSVSRNTFIRKLPKSYKYLTEMLHGHILQGYNIVGDGTRQALIPILTGQTEFELPETRTWVAEPSYVDVYPFIWNDFKNVGYVTGFLEDMPNAGIFTRGIRGFNNTPTDHYMRTYYITAEQEQKTGYRFCDGSIPKHKVMMNHIKHFFSVYKEKPKFLFAFHGELSHDYYNLIGAADDDLLQLLKDLHDSGALQDTLLILMADHGHRFGDIRNTIQGKQEERMPFFSFTFPKWFKQIHKKAYDNFISNINTLTTPFDIHATLKSVIHLGNTGNASLKHRSISLFSKIPPTRSCAHAFIQPHWCACLKWISVPLSNPITQRLGNFLVKKINDYTSTHRKLCAELSLSNISWVIKLRPNEDLINFGKMISEDAHILDMSANTEVKSDVYQIKTMLRPGNSLFEASITHILKSNQLHLKLSDISRINKYGRQARCIENDFPDLRKYCYCKD